MPRVLVNCEAYVLGGVTFDGFAHGALLDAKSGYGSFVDAETEHSRTGFPIARSTRRQLKAANGTPIEWIFDSQNAADATRTLFEEEGITGVRIRVLH